MSATPSTSRFALLVSVTLLAAGVFAVVGVGTKVLTEPKSPVPEAPPVVEEIIRVDPVDRLGDPLPPHAVARLGTVRLSQDGYHEATFSPDGKLLATDQRSPSMWGRAVCLWEVSTGKERRRFLDALWPLAFSPDGLSLACTGGPARTLRLLEVETGRERWRWDEKAPQFCRVVFAPDGKNLAVAASDATVRICSTATGVERLRIAKDAYDLTFAPDGKVLASRKYQTDTVSLWDTSTGKLLHALVHPQPVWSSAFSPDSRTLVVRCQGNQLTLWDRATGKTIRTVSGSSNDGEVRFSADGTQLRMNGWTFDLTTGKETTFPPGTTEYTAISDDGRWTATNSHGALRIWDNAGREVVKLDRHLGGIDYAIPSADGETIRTVGRFDGKLYEWSRGGKLLRETRLPERSRFLALSADGKTLAMPHPREEYALLELPAATLVVAGGHKRNEAVAMALSADAGLLAVASGENVRMIHLWDTRTGKRLTFDIPGDPFSSLAISPDGKTLAGAASLERLTLWDIATGEVRRGPVWRPQAREYPSEKSIRPAGWKEGRHIPRYKGNASRTAGLVFSPSGKTLAVSSGRDRHVFGNFGPSDAYLVRLYDVITGKELFQLLDQEPVVAFSPDGATLATACHSDYVVYLWDAATGRQKARFEGHSKEVTSLAFTADGRRLISGSEDSTALVWAVPGK